jgi:uncharacterized protein YndB with AHSA1/START domain
MAASEPTGQVSRHRGTVRLERRFRAAVERVWAAWTEPTHLERWLGPIESGRPGPEASFVVRMAPDETATCTVTRWEPPRLLELEWLYTAEGPTRLRVELHRADDGGTRLVLDHRHLHTVDPVDYAAGWHLHLDSLASALEGTLPPDFAAAFPIVRATYATTADVEEGRA